MNQSILYLNKEEVFGNTPIWNKDTGKTLPLYCAPFTLSDQDYSSILSDMRTSDNPHDAIIRRLMIAISYKGYKWYNIHWASKIVLYWKE